MRGLVEEFPDPRSVAARDGGGDVAGGVAQVDGVDLCRAVCGQKTGREGQNSTAVGGCRLREDADDPGGIVLD